MNEGEFSGPFKKELNTRGKLPPTINRSIFSKKSFLSNWELNRSWSTVFPGKSLQGTTRLLPYFWIFLFVQLSCTGHISAQTITPQGTDVTLDVATWNIEWFGDASNGPSNDDRQYENVKIIIDQADIDLWAVQEIADEDDFNRLISELSPAYDGVLATESGGSQRIGFIYNTDVINLRGDPEHILNQDNFLYDFAGRPPLQIEADVVLPDTIVTVFFITVHMKALGDLESYNRRVSASGRLKNRIDFSSLHNKPVIVLGDFNDELVSSTYAGRTSPYSNFLQDTDNYFFPSLAVEQAGSSTYIGFSPGSNLDHILITNELIPAYEPASADTYAELPQAFFRYASTTSDHLPVFARFRFSVNTALEAAEMPASVRPGSTYPNPFYDQVTVSYHVDRPGPVTVKVFDVLGRTVATLTETFLQAGTYEARFDATGLSGGLYLIRFNTAGYSTVRRVLRLP